MKKKFLFIIATAFALLVTLASCSVYSSITKDKFVTDMTSVDETKIPAYDRCVIKYAYSVDGEKQSIDPNNVYSDTYIFDYDKAKKDWVYSFSGEENQKAKYEAAAAQVKMLIGRTYASLNQAFPDDAKYSLGGTNYKVELGQQTYYFNNFGYITCVDTKAKENDKNVETIFTFQYSVISVINVETTTEA